MHTPTGEGTEVAHSTHGELGTCGREQPAALAKVCSSTTSSSSTTSTEGVAAIWHIPHSLPLPRRDSPPLAPPGPCCGWPTCPVYAQMSCGTGAAARCEGRAAQHLAAVLLLGHHHLCCCCCRCCCCHALLGLRPPPTLAPGHSCSPPVGRAPAPRKSGCQAPHPTTHQRFPYPHQSTQPALRGCLGGIRSDEGG